MVSGIGSCQRCPRPHSGVPHWIAARPTTPACLCLHFACPSTPQPPLLLLLPHHLPTTSLHLHLPGLHLVETSQLPLGAKLLLVLVDDEQRLLQIPARLGL